MPIEFAMTLFLFAQVALMTIEVPVGLQSADTRLTAYSSGFI
jgi:hypothetical protein